MEDVFEEMSTKEKVFFRGKQKIEVINVLNFLQYVKEMTNYSHLSTTKNHSFFIIKYNILF